jgi:Leucine-rich repeat (LRR) protein
VKHNYEGLSSLPVVAHCVSVRYLYLSHNKIASLNGLQHYPNLKSLNASYNCLTKVAELRLLKNPELMDKLSLRMNRLEFGYQDYVVEVLPNLRRL